MKELSIKEAQDAFKSGGLTCRQLVESFLNRIASLDSDGPKINSMLTRSTTALEEADKLDAHLKETSEFVGPLHGIPIVVKDQADTIGMVTTYGSIIAKDNVPTEDATIVKKLKKAGAVILGKTTMPDWATSFHSSSTISGLTCNPYALHRDPGGSSSGTGAAVAANFGILGVGEDTGGSIRVPSSFNSLVGIRCTPGLISRSGLSPLLATQDTAGPMAKTVMDTALMLDILAGYDPADPYTATAVVTGPPAGGSYSSNLEGAKPLSKLRIGVLRQTFGPDSDPECHVVNEVINACLSTLSNAGATLVDVEIPNLPSLLASTATYFTSSRFNLDEFLKTKKPQFNTDVAKIYAEKKYHPTLDLFEGIAKSPKVPEKDPSYLARLIHRDELQRLIIGLFGSNDLDCIAYPTCKIPPPTHKDVLAQRWSCLDFPTNTIIAAHALVPAISVPVGYTKDTEDGDLGDLPVGLELLGLPYREQGLLGVAYRIEKETMARKRPWKLPE